MKYPKMHLALAALFFSGTATAQTLGVSFIADSTNDALYRLQDGNSDGDYNDAGEITLYYDDTLGGESLQLNTGIENGPAGQIFMCDGGEDEVFLLQDLNADNDALDPGEITVFFDGNVGGNASAVLMSSAQDLCWDAANEVLWIANAGAGGADDSIIRLEDISGDGDANDFGEAVEYYVPAPGGANGDSAPQDVALGPNGELYYVEAGSTGVIAKGVYRLEDTDMSGTINAPGEIITYYAPMNLQTGFPTHLTLASDGAWYMSDQLSDNVRRFEDVSMDGVIQDGVEDSIWYDSPAASILWEINEAPDGAFYALESQTPDRLLRFEDLDMSGAIDQPGETTEVYDDSLGDIGIGNPRGLCILPELPDSIYLDLCNGDGGNQMGCTDCPCGNNAAAGTIGGCLNSAGTSTQLAATGSSSISLPPGATNDLRFTASGAPATSTNVLLSGNAVSPQNMANPCFGMDTGSQAMDRDGLRCAVQVVVRHGNRTADAMGNIDASAGSSRVWGGEAQPTAGLGVQGGFIAGQTRYFQITHRDDAMAVCMRGLNTSQAVEVTFLP